MNACGYLPTGDGHFLYWERHGTVGAQPLILLHGGPGGSTSPRHLTLLDPARFDIVLFHQRGCGRSRPEGRLAHNSTERLLDDIEHMRRFQRLEQVVLLGISWGAWLALAYRRRHPERVKRVVAALAFAPFAELVRDYQQQVQGHLELPMAELAVHLGSSDPRVRRQAALAWAEAQLRMAGRQADPHKLARFVDESAVRAIRLELHYHLNHYFVTDPAAHLSLDERVHLVQGARSPMDMASLERLRALGSFHAQVIDSGHDPFHPAMQAAIRGALAQGS